jgi:uncharacterized protein YdeI (YjbR/CyaY-like superfamily)
MKKALSDKNNANVFFELGCGRCNLFGTNECKIHQWPNELLALRKLLQASGLQEERKWGAPIYTLHGKGVVMLGVLKDHCVVSFLKGVLLKDNEKILVSPGENSQSVKYCRIYKTTKLHRIIPILERYIQEAIILQNTGQKITLKTIDEYEVPTELTEMMMKNKELREIYEALTPGRKRSYLMHFLATKNSKTRIARIERCIEKMKLGKGFNEY